jgi:hypothetical protein
MLIRGLIAALTLVAAGAVAHADNGTKAEQAACRPDVRKFCSQLGGANNQQYRDCLQFHMQELSQKCQQVLMNHQNQP